VNEKILSSINRTKPKILFDTTPFQKPFSSAIFFFFYIL